MLRKPLIYAVGWMLLTAAGGCAERDEIPGDAAVRITASVAAPLSRTSMSGTTASFASGDNIGVFETLTGRSNVAYAYNGSAWSTSTPMYWRDGTSTHAFYAYYPYAAAFSGTKAQIPVLSTQTITTSVSPATDLLVSGPRNQTRSAGVPLSFTHGFALIQLNVKLGILNLVNIYYLNRITIQGGNPAGNSNRFGIANITGAPAQVGYDLTAGAVVAATNDSQSYAQSFYSDITGVTLTTTALTFYVFVLPGTYTNPLPGVLFRITVLGLVSNSTVATFPNTTFAAGNKYVYNVSIGLLNRSESSTPTLVAQKPVLCDVTTIDHL